jgi:hypothetical protein
MEAHEIASAECPPERLDVVRAGETRIPRMESSIDSTSRHADEDIGLDLRLGERSQHTNLITAERATTGEHEGERSRKCA